jgi:hypothetical protein
LRGVSTYQYCVGAFYTVTSAGGSFRLEDVPPGDFTLEVWHEELGKRRQKVKFGPNAGVNVVFEYVAKK